MTSSLKTSKWNTRMNGADTQILISVTRNNEIAIVAINQTRGIGSVYDATPDGVECLVGMHHDGLEEALARAITQILSVKRTILTLALRDYSATCVKQILGEIRKFQ